MRKLLNSRVPSSLERTTTPPTPVAETIFHLIMYPVSFAVTLSDENFRFEYIFCFSVQIIFSFIDILLFETYKFNMIYIGQSACIWLQWIQQI